MIFFSEHIKTLKSFALYAVLSAVVLLAQNSAVSAATRTWDGGGSGSNWSEAANWLDNIAPTSADDVIFNATSTKNATIDASFTVKMVSIESGYGGTITQSFQLNVTNSFTQSAGTFQGTTANASFGSLILNTGATFNAPSALLTLNSQTDYYLFTHNGGAFNANGGTVNADGRPDISYFSGQPVVFNNLTFSKPVVIFTSLVTNGNLTIGAAADLQSGYIEANGNVAFAPGANAAAGGSTEIRFADAAARTATISGTLINLPILVNNPNIIVTTAATSGTVAWTKRVTLQAGALRQTTADYLFSASAGFNNPGFSVAGGSFQGSAANAVFNTTIGISAGNFTAGTGDTGTNAAGCPAFPQANYFFQQSGGAFSGGAGNARFCDLRRSGGTFTAPSGNMTILGYADFAGGGFDANGGNLIAASDVSINAPNVVFFNVALAGTGGHSFSGAPKPRIDGTFNLTEGAFSFGEVALVGDLVYGASFAGGGGRIFFEGTATRTVNLPARSNLLGITLDNPNITVATSGAGASGFAGDVEIKRGLFRQANAALNVAPNQLRVAGGTFEGSAAELGIGALIVSNGTFSGGTGPIGGAFGASVNQSGGTFSAAGNVEITGFTLSGGTFNAPAGTMTVIADWINNAGGTFNAGSGTVRLTGYNTFNCINQINTNVGAGSTTFNNLIIANSFCNQRYITGTLIVAGEFRLAYGSLAGGRIRPLGTTVIDATYNGYGGSTVVEYLAANRNFVIANPSSTVNMLPVEMNAANSTLTNSGTGRINFVSMNLANGTVNQGASVWDITNPGYAQSGGTFNGGASELFISNGAGNPLLTGGAFVGSTGRITGSFRIAGGAFSTVGDMEMGALAIEGGTFDAPLGTLSISQSFTHTLGGAFNARTGNVQTSTVPGVYGVFFDVSQSETFNNLRFNGTNNNANHFISANDTFVVNGILNFNGRGANGGSIVANGDVFYTNYGGYQNATTLVKFQDAAARSVTFASDCTSYFQPTLVDNPNITINTGCADSNAVLTWTSLELRRGTVNNGDARAFFSGSFTQSGGTFNAGGNSVNPSTAINGDFTLTGGVYNAAPFTYFAANYTHAGGGNFNYGEGTVIFGGVGGAIDIDGNENFYNLRFEQLSGATTKTIAAGDRLTANGNLDFRVGYVSGGTFDAKRNVAVTPNFSGGTANLTFSGAADQIFTNTGGVSPSGNWTINKPNSVAAAENSFAPAAPTNLLISGNIGNATGATYVPLAIVSGNAVQTGTYNHALASLSVSPAASFVNEFGGTITLSGNVTNDGIVRLNANGAGCQADAIALRSSSGERRSWNGSGYFFMTDIDVSGQDGTSLIRVYNGTNSGNNGANWVFDASCLVPTAASVSIGGRVLNHEGRGIAGVSVVLTDAAGQSRAAITNAFGNYSFAEVAVGQMIVVSVSSKKFVFANTAHVINVAQKVGEINFTADAR